MRKLVIITTFILTSSFLQAQIVVIPDANFKAALLNHDPKIDLNNDYEIQLNEAQVVKHLSVANSSIADLTGIEYFTYFITLNCYNNQITKLDLSKNTALTSLNLNVNFLNNFDASKNLDLTTLSCYFNNLKTLNVSKNTALTTLN